MRRKSTERINNHNIDKNKMDVDSKLSEIYSSDYESNSKSKSEGSSDSGNPIRREEVKNNEG